MMDVINAREDNDPLRLAENRNLPRPPRIDSAASQQLPVLPSLVPQISLPEEEPTLDPTQAIQEAALQGEIVPEDTRHVQPQAGQSDLITPQIFNNPNLRYPNTSPMLTPGTPVGELLGNVLSDRTGDLNTVQYTQDSILRTQNLRNLGPEALIQRSGSGRNAIVAQGIQNAYGGVPSNRARTAGSNLLAQGIGIAGVSAFTRNVMAGQPFHPMTQDALAREQANTTRGRFNDGRIDGPLDAIGTTLRNALLGGPTAAINIARVVGNAIKFRVGQINRGIREEGVQSYAEALRARQTDIVRGMSADAIDLAAFTLRPRGLPGEEQFAQFFTNIAEGVRGPIEARPRLSSSVNEGLAEFYQQSPAFQSLINSVEPMRNADGASVVSPLAGQFGDFGSAGSLSALLWLANIPEGTLTGGLYELAELTRSGLARVTGNQTQQQRANTSRNNLFSGLAGQDLGIMQPYSERNYLSFVGNPALEFIPRKGQWYLGFLADMALGGFADAPIDALLFARRQSTPTLRAARQAIELNPSAIVRNVTENPNLPLEEMPLEVFNYNVNRMVQGVTADPRSFQGVVEARLRQGIQLPSGGALTTTLPTVTQYDLPSVQQVVEINNNINRLEDLINQSVDPVSRANYGQARENLFATAQELQQQLGTSYQQYTGAIIAQAQERGTIEVVNGVIRGTDARLDTLIPTVTVEELAPTFPRYSLAPQAYRANPSISPSSLELVRRTDEELINLAKHYGLEDVDDVFISNLRLALLQREHPELLSPWGRPVSENLTRPIIRMGSEADPVLELPPSSAVVDTPPIVTITITGTDVITEVDEVETQRIVRRVRTLDQQFNNTLPTEENVGRLQRITREVQTLLEQNPQVARLHQLENLPPELRPVNTVTETIEAAIEIQQPALREASIASDLRQQLAEIDNVVKEQEAILQREAPLERTTTIAESVTRASNNEETLMSSVMARNTASDVVDVNLFPAMYARETGQELTSRHFATLEAYDTEVETFLPSGMQMEDLRQTIDLDGGDMTTLRGEFAELSRAQQDKLFLEAMASDDIEPVTIAQAAELDETQLRQSIPQGNEFIVGLRRTVVEAEDASSTEFIENFRNTFAEEYTYYDVPIYSQDLGDDINRFLRKGSGESVLNAELQPYGVNVQQAIDIIDADLNRLPVHEGVVYRGIRGFHEDIEELFPVGSTVSDKAYTSSSISRSEAEDFLTPDSGSSFEDGRGAILTIQSESGRRVLQDQTNTAEVIFPRDTEFVVESITPIDSPPYEGTEILQITLREKTRTVVDAADVSTPATRSTIESTPSAFASDNPVFDRLNEHRKISELPSSVTDADLRAMQREGLVSLRPVEDPYDIVRGERFVDFGDDDHRYYFIALRSPSTTVADTPVSNVPVDTMYHGTKGRLSRHNGPSSTSLTNELGPGTYLTNDKVLAQQYARAMPSKDRVDIASRTTRFTDKGRVYSASLKPDARVLDVNSDEGRDHWRNFVLDAIGDDPAIVKRFRGWSRPSRTRKGSNFLHYVRSQYIKKYGKDAYAKEYSNFLDRLNTSLPYDALKYGDITNVINPRMLDIRSVVEDRAAAGSMAEGLLSRHAVDMRMHADLNSSTTKAILEDDRLDLDVLLQQQLENASGQQERTALETMQELNRREAAARAENMKALLDEPDQILKRKLDEVVQQNRNIIRDQGDDCL